MGESVWKVRHGAWHPQGERVTYENRRPHPNEASLNESRGFCCTHEIRLAGAKVVPACWCEPGQTTHASSSTFQSSTHCVEVDHTRSRSATLPFNAWCVLCSNTSIALTNVFFWSLWPSQTADASALRGIAQLRKTFELQLKDFVKACGKNSFFATSKQEPLLHLFQLLDFHRVVVVVVSHSPRKLICSYLSVQCSSRRTYDTGRRWPFVHPGKEDVTAHETG